MNLFKRKKNKFPTDSAVRTLEEINADYGKALAKAGQTQYLVYVYTQELEQSNRQLLSLNQEAKSRNDLDAAAARAKPKAAAQEVQNEQA